MGLFIQVALLLLSVTSVYITSGSTSSADAEAHAKGPVDLEQQFEQILDVCRQDFEIKLESIKIQLQNELLQSELRHQVELERLGSQLQIEKSERQQVENDLKVKLVSVSEENQALKTELISFFKKMSNLKQLDRPSPESKSQEVVHEGQLWTEMDIEISNLTNKSGSNSESNKPDSDSDQSHVILSISSTGGVSYIRWGRTSCEGDATVLYTGYVVQKMKQVTDSTWPGSGYVCLHSSPQWGTFAESLRDWSTISGVEYADSTIDTFSTENNKGLPLSLNDIPCTVCQVDTKSNQLMIPGRNSCPSGWTLEYWGYLVTNDYIVDGNPYLCMDQAPESIPGGSASGGLPKVGPVEVFCRGTLCPPYIHGYEITCAVCSK